MEKPGSRYDRRYRYPTSSSTIEECMEMVINNTGAVTRILVMRMRGYFNYRGHQWRCVTYDWAPYVEWRDRLLADINDKRNLHH